MQGDGGSARTRDEGSVELASNVSAEGLEKEDVQQKEPKKRKRDWAESGEDALVPHEPLARVMRRALKPSTNLERAAVKIMQVSVSELVMVVVGEATEHAIEQGRLFIAATDILWALRQLGLEVYTASLETMLEKLKEKKAAPAPATHTFQGPNAALKAQIGS